MDAENWPTAIPRATRSHSISLSGASPLSAGPGNTPTTANSANKIEEEWVPELQRMFDLAAENLPVPWGCEFVLGPRSETDEDTCARINASSVSPFPDSAPSLIARAVYARVGAASCSRN